MAAGSGCDLFFFFLVLTLIWGPPKIILPRAPQSVRPGLQCMHFVWYNEYATRNAIYMATIKITNESSDCEKHRVQLYLQYMIFNTVAMQVTQSIVCSESLCWLLTCMQILGFLDPSGSNIYTKPDFNNSFVSGVYIVSSKGHTTVPEKVYI